MVEVSKEAVAALHQAIRDLDEPRQMQIVTEQINQTNGHTKAYWLFYRAGLRRQNGLPEHAPLIRKDTEEGLRLSADVPGTVFLEGFIAACQEQNRDWLRGVPYELRRHIVPDLYGSFHYWQAVGFFHMAQGRWYQAFRSRTRQIRIYQRFTDAEMSRLGGWFSHIHAFRARAGMRCGRIAQAEADIAAAMDFNAQKERKHVNPMPLMMARAELAFLQGDHQTARMLVQEGRAQGLAVLQRTPQPEADVDLHLFAAHMAAAEGNQTAFAHFCEQALQAASRGDWPWTQARVRRVMAGQLELKR